MLRLALPLLLALAAAELAEPAAESFAKSSAEPFADPPAEPDNTLEHHGLEDTELVLAYVVFRHGDRTPDREELDLYQSDTKITDDVFFPFGMKALTNKGKQRGFRVGEYLRRRYGGPVSRLYLPEQVTMRTTDFARTKMTALTALAGLFPPPPAQAWSLRLGWQPVPYDTLPFDDDDLLYWYNCPRYLWLRDRAYAQPDVRARTRPLRPLLAQLTALAGTNITTTENVFYLDNLFQALENVGLPPPKWAKELMPQIKEVTKLEYAIENYNMEMIRLSTGVLMSEIVSAMANATRGRPGARLRLVSAHENNVAALMAAAGVFTPHQPKYGATFSLELRRRKNGQFGVAAVYLPEPGVREETLRMAGCGGSELCELDTFLKLAGDACLSLEQYKMQCPLLS